MPEPVAVEYPEGYDWLAHLRGYVPMLADLAKRNKSTDLYADWTLDNAPSEMVDRIAAVAGNADFVDTVVRLVPELNTYEGWFREFVQHIADKLTDAGDDDDAEVAGA